MVWCILFGGAFYAVQGILGVMDTIEWKNEAGEDFINHAISYGQFRHDYYKGELALYVALIVFGLLIMLTAFLCRFKRCSHCGNYVHKKQSFCHSCGDKIS